MPAALAAGDLRARHAERGVGVAGHGAREGVEVSGPAAAGFELVRRAVEGCVAGGAFLVEVGDWGQRVLYLFLFSFIY